MLGYGVGVSFFSSFFTVELDSMFESPVVSKPGGACVLEEFGLLVVVRVQFVFVCSTD